jgi:hypothetical protein
MNMVIRFHTTEEPMFITLLALFAGRVVLGEKRNDAIMW